jgi:hypothetical protein
MIKKGRRTGFFNNSEGRKKKNDESKNKNNFETRRCKQEQKQKKYETF